MNPLLIHQYLERLSNLLRNDLRKFGKQYGLQPVHVSVLHYLALCNRFSDTPLSVTEYLGLSRGTVSQTIIILENKGLIEKRRDPQDRRVIHLALTPQGKNWVDKTMPAPILEKACHALPADQHNQILDALKLILHSCQQANAMKSFGVCYSCRYHQIRSTSDFYCALTQQPLSVDDAQKICREHSAQVEEVEA